MTDSQRRQVADQIIKAAQNGDTNRVDDLVEHLLEKGRQAGKNDLLADLVDAEEISADGVEFAIENNGCTDPR